MPEVNRFSRFVFFTKELVKRVRFTSGCHLTYLELSFIWLDENRTPVISKGQTVSSPFVYQ